MSEPGIFDIIALNHAMIVSLTMALMDAGALSPSEIASQCRRTAKDITQDPARTQLLAFAESLERAEARAERLLAPGWTPEVLVGGKDEDEGEGSA